jgi:hypothetical protein
MKAAVVVFNGLVGQGYVALSRRFLPTSRAKGDFEAYWNKFYLKLLRPS